MEIKKSAELVVVGGMLALSLAAPYANATDISSAVTSQTVDVTVSAAGGYVLEAFKLNISSNVALSYNGDTTAVGVRTGSAKGMHTFGGSSNGGSVKQCQATSIATPNTAAAGATTLGC